MCNDMHVRDFLATTTVVDNGKKTGAAANMILGEFKRANRKDKCTHLVKIVAHKTDGTYGPAALAVLVYLPTTM